MDEIKVTPAQRERLAYEATLQMSDLFDAMHDMVAEARNDESSALLTAIAARGGALASVALCAPADQHIDDHELAGLIRTLAPRITKQQRMEYCSPTVKSPWQRDDSGNVERSTP